MPGGSGVWGVPGIRDEASWQGKAKNSRDNYDRVPVGPGFLVDRRAPAGACLANLGFLEQTKSVQVAQPVGRFNMAFACQASLTRLAAIPSRKSGMGKNGKMQDSCLSHGSQSRAGHIDGCNGRAEERGHLTDGLSRGHREASSSAWTARYCSFRRGSQRHPRPWSSSGSTASVSVNMNASHVSLGPSSRLACVRCSMDAERGKRDDFGRDTTTKLETETGAWRTRAASGAWLALSPNRPMTREPQHRTDVVVSGSTRSAGEREMTLATVRFAMSRVRHGMLSCCWLHRAKVKMNRRDAVGCVRRRWCSLGGRTCCGLLQRRSVNLEPGSASRTGPALPEPGNRDADPGDWTGLGAGFPVVGRAHRRNFRLRPPNRAVKILLSGRSRAAKQDHCLTDVAARPDSSDHQAKDAGGCRGHREKQIRATWEIRLDGPSARIAANRRHLTPRPFLCMK